MEKLIIGSHVSFTKEKQLLGCVLEAIKYGSNTFMFYTGAPQNTVRMPIDKNLTVLGKQLMKDNDMDINDVVIHAPYIINLANIQNSDFGISFLKEEIRRGEELGINKIVLHPGSHVGIGIKEGIENIIKCLNHVIDETTKTTIYLEVMAGKGSEIGSSLEEIKMIIDGIKIKEKVGICLDTCHMNDAGYDISDFDSLLNKIDRLIGLDKIGCIHINDSKNISESHKDRHENFGMGTLGFDNLIKVIYSDKLKNVPKILETPYVTKTDDSKERLYPPYKEEIAMILAKKNDDHLIDKIRSSYK